MYIYIYMYIYVYIIYIMYLSQCNIFVGFVTCPGSKSHPGNMLKIWHPDRVVILFLILKLQFFK